MMAKTLKQLMFQSKSGGATKICFPEKSQIHPSNPTKTGTVPVPVEATPGI